MTLQINSIQNGRWLQYFSLLALLLFSLSSCQEDKSIVPEKAGVTEEEFTDAVVADEHFQNALTIISAGLDGKVDESAIEEQLTKLFNAEETDYLRSMFELIPISGSDEEHAKAVFSRLNERISAEFEALYDISEGPISPTGLGEKATPCFDRLTEGRASIQNTFLICMSGAVIAGNYEAAVGCEALAVVQLNSAYIKFHRCLRNNY